MYWQNSEKALLGGGGAVAPSGYASGGNSILRKW